MFDKTSCKLELWVSVGSCNFCLEPEKATYIDRNNRQNSCTKNVKLHKGKNK